MKKLFLTLILCSLALSATSDSAFPWGRRRRKDKKKPTKPKKPIKPKKPKLTQIDSGIGVLPGELSESEKANNPDLIQMTPGVWILRSKLKPSEPIEPIEPAFTVVKNQLVRNKSDSEEVSECEFMRYYVAKYKFKNSKHEYIWYYVFQCLANDMSVIRSNVTFNYNGNQDAEKYELPKGCLPPPVSSPPENPCKNGFDLGEDLINNITKLATKKMCGHPKDIKPTGTNATLIPEQKLTKLTKELPDLQKLLDKVVLDSHASNPKNRVPNAIKDNKDGSVTEIYEYHNGNVVEKTINLDKTIFTVMINKDGTTVTKKEQTDGTAKMIKRNHSGKVTEIRSIEPILDSPDDEKITIMEPDGTQIGKSFVRPKNKGNSPLSYEVSEDILNAFDEVAEDFADVLEEYVEAKVRCFSENLIDISTNYLSFVCSTTGHKSIRDAIKARFGDAALCNGQIDCDAIQNTLIDQMVMHTNAGKSTDDLKVGPVYK